MIDRNESYVVPPFDCLGFVLLDIETSGLNEVRDRVISVSADKIVGGKLTEHFFSFVAFEGDLPPEIVELTGIRNEMLKGKPNLKTLRRFAEICPSMPTMRRSCRNF